MDNIISQGLLPLITKPTRLTHHSATLIDHIYTNDKKTNTFTGILLTDEVADHFGVFHIMYGKEKKNPSKVIYSRNITDEKMKQFKKNLSETDFSDVLLLTNPNEAYNKFISIYTSLFEELFPLRPVNFKKKYIKQHPWMTKGLLVSSIQKSKLLKKKLNKPTHANITAYNAYNIMYRRLLRIQKTRYYTDMFNNNKSNIKKTWEVLNEVIHRSKDKSSIPTIMKINNIETSDIDVITDNFNNYFVNLG